MLRYLRGTMNTGLEFKTKGRKPGDPWELQMYVDSDYANDRVARRSKTRWLIFLNGNLVSFGSRLQTSVARSSTEAEYMALSMAAKEFSGWVLQQHIICLFRNSFKLSLKICYWTVDQD
jgi:hypothetical protein